ncbi:MAG: PKD domain-containing protein [Gammaproteobacteria bacterium]
MKLQIQPYIVSALLLIAQGCSTTPEQVETPGADLTQSLPPTSAGIPTESLYFSSIEEAEKALSGYNYGLVNLPDGRVQAFVSGYIGSGIGNPITPGQSPSKQGNMVVAEITEGDAEMPFPEVSLAEKKNGQAAIDALGDKIGDVAKSYGMSQERLEEILRTDSTAWVDETGHLLYVDTHPGNPSDRVEEATTVSSSPTSTFTDIANASAPFALHSKPGSSRIIYLDFNGHVAASTAWSSATLTLPPYDIDNNPNTFGDKELSNIKEIWQRVAEDYAPFDVDVTTQEPSSSALERTSSLDTQYGARAVITRSIPQLCNQSCGGVAYVNVFSYYSAANPNRFKPAWVFLDKLGKGYPRYVAEAISHEVGHNLNLTHDGNQSTAYYAGHGSGITSWAPIMGVGYYKALTQWSKGEYPGANNHQDDVAVIHAAGAPIRADDFANTLAGAAPLGGNAGDVNQVGVIERDTDVDIFAFSTAGGATQFTVSPDAISPNLDVSVKVLDAAGKSIAQADPVNSLDAAISVSLGSGQYFLQVEGVGKGDLSTGYSDYGSLGQYRITGSYSPGSVASAPTAVISSKPVSGDAPLSVSFDSSASTGTIAGYYWNFGDGSSSTGGPVVSHTYNKAGKYTATLTLTGQGGAKDSTSELVDVIQSRTSTSMKSADVKVLRKSTGNRAQCVARVTVKYGGSPVSGALVSGTWNGSIKVGARSFIYTGRAKRTTNKNGVADLVGSWLPTYYHGSCAFTVNNVSKKGYTYEGNGNVSASFTW